jgi:diguanylate cyclase (GGDEF)-like protein
MIIETTWRHDPLSGLGNMLAFIECLAKLPEDSSPAPTSVVYIDVANIREINLQRGYEAGDQALRWLALALMDELPLEHSFRLRGDEFAAVCRCDLEEACRLAERIRQRFANLAHDHNGSGNSVHEGLTPLHLSVLHLERPEEVEVADIVIAMESLMQKVKSEGGSFATARYPVAEGANLRTTLSSLIDRVLELGEILDHTKTLAETDPLTALPNSRAMSRTLEEQIAAGGSSFALLLVDGDNLRSYNKISYAAGDEMLRQLAKLLQRALRDEDRLARWRMGDEFLILLPRAGATEASNVAERLVLTVRESEWLLPVTISIGIALYPEHGNSTESLIESAELALSSAKEQGKDRAFLPPAALAV